MKHTLLLVDDFIARRQQLLAKMPLNSAALVFAATEVTRSNDTEFPFCQNKNFYYLTGFNEPEAILLLIKAASGESDQTILFCRMKDPLQEVWHGRRIGPEKAQADYGVEQAFSLAEADTMIASYLQGKTTLLFCQSEASNVSERAFHYLAQVQKNARRGDKAPTEFIDCAPMIHEMRLIKSAAELAVMRQVNHISGLAHQRAMRSTKTGKFEYQIEADLLHEFAQHGARYPAYSSIVAGGDNANILHYTDNGEQLVANDLLLIDAGGELAGYAADITRTFPVNGRFTAEQKIIYQLVLDAQELAIAAVQPDANFSQLNAIVTDYFTRQLHQLGILSGELPQLLADKASKKYFIHGLGHWLGLDVHDVGDYHSNDQGQQRAFIENMVMTIEPGLYIPLDDDSVAEKWRGIGVRIEDNIVVTADGCENLTVNSPKTVQAIESLMASNNELSR